MENSGLSELYRHDVVICNGCRRNQRRVKAYRITAIYSIITCGIFVIASIVFFATIVSQVAKLNDRLNDFASANDELKSRVADLERSVQNTSTLTQRPQSLNMNSLNRDVGSSQFEVLPDVHTRRKRRAKKNNPRRRKKCKNCLPVVQIEGAGGFSKENKTDLLGFWKTSTWSKSQAKFFDTNRVNQNGKLKVVKDGLYLLYAQMTLAGEFKRGYFVKKEPQKTSIASCINFSNGDAPTDNKSCPTLAIVKLEKGDSIYVEEIETNTSMNYSEISAVFGLIRVGD